MKTVSQWLINTLKHLMLHEKCWSWSCLHDCCALYKCCVWLIALAMLERHVMAAASGSFFRLLGLVQSLWLRGSSCWVTPRPTLSHPTIFSLVFLYFVFHARSGPLMPVWDIFTAPFERRAQSIGDAFVILCIVFIIIIIIIEYPASIFVQHICYRHKLQHKLC